jgi:putative colanic acid biosynthesis acetyltransferase WcaF
MSDSCHPRSLGRFTGAGYDKGRSKGIQILWFSVLNIMFLKWWCPPRLRPVILRLFGGRIGRRVLIRHRVRVQWPWKLEIGDDSWVGEDAWLLNLEPVRIGHDVCISQGALLCTGGHDPRSSSFEFANAPITVDSHAWIGAQSLVLPGVTVGEGAVVGARALVLRDVSAGAAAMGTHK